MSELRAAAADPSRVESPLLDRVIGRRLHEQINWFIRLRYIAVVGMGLATALAGGLDLVPTVTPLYLLALLTLGANALYVWRLRGANQRDHAALRRHVDLQIAVDLMVLTTLLHYSGGVANPLVLFYLFHAFIAALLRSLRAAVVVSITSLLLLCGLGFGEFYGVLPRHELRIGLFAFDRIGVGELVLWLGTLATAMAFSIYFVSSIVRQLSKRDQELVGLSRQLALSEKLASIGTLAAGVSHEINNPVGVILSKTKILRYRIEDSDPPDKLLAELETVEKHTRRIGDITAGLLTFSRETPFEFRPVPVNELVQEGADLVKVPFRSAEIGLDLRIDPQNPVVSGSSNHLLQVLVNILLNARDASESGTRVALVVESDDRKVRIAIRDTGEGIDEATLVKIFDPFFTTKDVDRGTGLGLALSHGIVERHDGRIDVESAVGEGSCFTVVLDRQLAES